MPFSGEPLRGFSVQEASRACDTSLRCFVRELLIGSRDILHPPTPRTLPPTYAPFATIHTWVHLSVGVPGEKGNGQSAMMLCLDEKKLSVGEGRHAHSLQATGAFISSSEFQEAVQYTMERQYSIIYYKKYQVCNCNHVSVIYCIFFY